LAAICFRIILPFHEPSTSFYRKGGLEFEEPNTTEMKAKFKCKAFEIGAKKRSTWKV